MYEYATVFLAPELGMVVWQNEINEWASNGWRLVAVSNDVAFMERPADMLSERQV
ncbi:hypothetical protein [Actinopolymorpha pittospori]|uniref:DUF4177 domain-containing protein n=1 Tax=Actinopolymorpha pittospori TaxID=648752 RepID=A0A927R9X2_9ACTN|nr:hypothetical protein [Actinopolymorpha pittospori]MBE1606964.1 hypothetical protein [Actinopolymorpha pittospori]